MKALNELYNLYHKSSFFLSPIRQARVAARPLSPPQMPAIAIVPAATIARGMPTITTVLASTTIVVLTIIYDLHDGATMVASPSRLGRCPVPPAACSSQRGELLAALNDVEAAMQIILGSARSMGIEVKG